MDFIPGTSSEFYSHHHLIPCSLNILLNAFRWRVQYGCYFSRREERKPEAARGRLFERPPLHAIEDEGNPSFRRKSHET